MNLIRLLKISVIVWWVSGIYGGNFLKQFVKPDSTQKFFVGIVEEKQKQLEELKKEQEELVVSDKVLLEKIVRQVQEIQVARSAVEIELKRHPDEDFLIKKQSLLNESEQVLKDIQRSIEDSASLLNELIAQLNLFIEDAEFENFKKKHKLQDRLYYTFDDLQQLHEYILDYERRVVQLADQEKTLHIEKESRKRNLALIQDEYEKKQQDIKHLSEIVSNDVAFAVVYNMIKNCLSLMSICISINDSYVSCA